MSIPFNPEALLLFRFEIPPHQIKYSLIYFMLTAAKSTIVNKWKSATPPTKQDWIHRKENKPQSIPLGGKWCRGQSHEKTAYCSHMKAKPWTKSLLDDIDQTSVWKLRNHQNDENPQRTLLGGKCYPGESNLQKLATSKDDKLLNVTRKEAKKTREAATAAVKATEEKETKREQNASWSHIRAKQWSKSLLDSIDSTSIWKLRNHQNDEKPQRPHLGGKWYPGQSDGYVQIDLQPHYSDTSKDDKIHHVTPTEAKTTQEHATALVKTVEEN
ncbi:Hypothetical predicted protein [Pelobates cultripes]|uniref:Uncharacterized protein n=1 Tax=Pelobates cultripes TaxID=61616 RepID=A0AAD1SZS0_PELCU|nr:Hypothetical predicted protein [Pelobates cultripes]